jgi:hypothetical protein
MATKQCSSKASSLAGKILAGQKAKQKQTKTLAASVRTQDEVKGQTHRKTK